MLNIQFNRGFSGVIVDLISPRISVGWLKNWLNKPEADNT
jgi:hypothetical protein